MKVLLTGVAGFIGYHAAQALLEHGHEVKGIDSLNDYYDPALKRARLAKLEGTKNFAFLETDIADKDALLESAGREPFDVVVHLAAQAGVRHALKDPSAYVRSNLVGHHNMLELARASKTLGHFVYASSSSVYGNDTKAPFSEDALADHPVSFYGATKRAGELLSHSYAELMGLQTGLRFYGLWAVGRQTWLIGCLPKRFSRANRSKFSAKFAEEISPDRRYHRRRHAHWQTRLRKRAARRIVSTIRQQSARACAVAHSGGANHRQRLSRRPGTRR
jgi:nucleoside-diphosphate-sugar epimerase